MQALALITMWLTLLAAFLIPYGNHVITCFQDEKYILLIIGIVAFPFGWLHGLGAMFGWWA